MGNEPLISIIVPIYKVEDYLDRCIQSILNQSYKNIEIILVDDGSPDRCGSICDAYALTDSRVKVIHKENGGVSDARNIGLKSAKGSLIGFVDSDDFINPKMYELLLLELQSSDCDISICSYESFFNQIPKFDPTDVITKKVVLNRRQTLYGLFSINAINFIVLWNKLFKVYLFDDLHFPKGKTREDESIIHQLFYKARKTVFINKTLYYYFKRQGSIMHSNSFINELNYAEMQEERISFFHNNELFDLEHFALKKYCIWLMASMDRYRKQSDNDAVLFVNTIKKIKKEFIYKLLRDVPLSFWSRCLYFLSLTFLGKPLDYCAFRRIYRNDPIAGFLLNDSIQKII